MFVEESSKNALLKLLANCINIRCNLLELLASRFADVRGEYGYYIDTRGRKEAGAALAKCGHFTTLNTASAPLQLTSTFSRY